MVVINLTKIFSVIKKLVQSSLFVAFLYMSVKALMDVFSFRTILITTKEHRNVTLLPAFSVCENWAYKVKGFDKKDLVNGSMVMQSFKMKFNHISVLLFFNGGNGATDMQTFNLMDDVEIQKYLHDVNPVDVWTLQCKPFSKGNSRCMPCITFNGAHLKTQGIETVVISISMEADESSRHIWEEGVVQLHEEHQSFLLRKQFDWESAVTFSFKNQTRLRYKRLLQLTEKTCISKDVAKCIKDERYNPDREITNLIAEKINCTLPWSQFKREGMKDCRTENDYERYLDTIVKLQPQIKKIPTKCKYKTWIPLPYSESSVDGLKTTVVVELSLIDSKAIIKEEEVYMFSFDYFIGICGGYLGLFLGGSILGILEFFEGIITRTINHSSN